MGLPANRVDSSSVHARRARRVDKSALLAARARTALYRGIKRNYYLTQLRHQLTYMRGELRHQEPVIVYQRGKVGSSSVYHTLRNMNIGRPVFHVHFINAIERRHRQLCSELKLTPSAYFARSRHLVVSRYLNKEINRGLQGKKWKVITLIRDPLKQKISSFFQLIDLIIPDFEQRYRDKTLSVEALTEIFMERYKPEGALNDWFNRELQPVFGIDVFADSFTHACGYQIYRGERADLLLIRLEDLSRCATEAFGEFLGIADFKLVNENVTDNKTCAAVYQKFAKTVVLPDAYIDAVYDSLCARHFYAAAEIEKFKAQYRRRASRV